MIAEDGASVVRYNYGPYGEPNSWTGARFRYTGQIALPEVALYHYKARVYTDYGRTLSYQYDSGSNRTRLTWPDTNYVGYDYDAMNRVSAVRENGASSGAGVLGTYTYDTLSRRATLTRGNGTVSSLAYDNASRLTQLAQNLSGTTNDQTFDLAYSAASQISQRTLSNDAYNWLTPAASRSYSRNGLNQYTAISGMSFSYDTRGNLTSDGSRSFVYDLENRLTTVSGSASLSLAYDPLGRLRQTTAASVSTDYLYDGDALSAEYNGSTLLRRYVHGPGTDEPLTWYEGSGLTDRRYLITDQQGSVIAEDGSSAVRYSYGPYGEPNAWTGSRFRYTGQIALPEVALYHYKARVYDPVLGRFLQTDPVGYEDDFNLYAYVHGDPLNHADPTGTECFQSPCGYGSSRAQQTSQPQRGTTIVGVAASANVAMTRVGGIGASVAAGVASKGDESRLFVSVGGNINSASNGPVGGESIAAGVLVGQHTGETIDTGGAFVHQGVAGGDIVGGSAEVIEGRSADDTRMVVGSNVVVGIGEGASLYEQGSYTWVSPTTGEMGSSVAASVGAVDRLIRNGPSGPFDRRF